MDQNFAVRFENVSQELHSSKQKLIILEANVAHLTEENADLLRENSSLKANEREDKTRLKSISDTCQMNIDSVTDLKERLQIAVGEKEEAKKKVEELSSLLNTLRSDAGKVSSACECGPQMAALEKQVAELKAEKDQKKEQLAQAVVDLNTALEKSSQMKDELKELKEEVECLQMQISSQTNIIECQRENLEGLRSQAAVDDINMDTNKKGNSLFSEVEDRRVEVEHQLVKATEKVQKLTNRLSKEQKENQAMKNQISLMMRTANNAANEKQVRSLENQLEESKKRVLTLTQQLQEHKAHQSTPCHTLPKPEKKDESSLMSSYKTAISILEKKNEEQRKANDNLQVRNIQLDFLCTQQKNEARSLKVENDRLTGLNSHLNLVIDNLKNESDSNEESQGKEMIKISLKNETAKSAMPSGQLISEDVESTQHKKVKVEEDNKTHSSPNEANSNDQDLMSIIFGSKSKSVAFSEDTNILKELGNQQTEDTSKTERGSKAACLKRKHPKKASQVTKSSYQKIDYSAVEEEAPEWLS